MQLIRHIPIIFLSLFFSLQAVAASKPSLETSLDEVQKNYENMRTLKASFIQSSDRHDFAGQKQKWVQKGTLEVKKPGKLRWDYQEPQQKQYIGNGQNLWIYSPAEQQVILSSWDPSSVALQFLLGAGQLKRHFTFRALTQAEAKQFEIDDPKEWVYLTPKVGSEKDVGPISALLLRLNEKAKLIEEAVALDPIGTETHWTFKKIKLNDEISDARFEFKPPAGVEVLKY